MANRQFFGVQGLNLEEKVIAGSFPTNGAGVAASLAIGTSTAAVTYTADVIGPSGNAITVAHVQGAAGLSVSVTGQAITVTLAAAGSTANAVAAAVNANVPAAALVNAVGGGTGAAIAATAAPLASGAGGVPATTSGMGFTVSYTGTGTYVVNLKNPYQALVACACGLQLATPTKQEAQMGAVNVTNSGTAPQTATITTLDTSSGSAVDVAAAAGNRVNFWLQVKTTAAPPA